MRRLPIAASGARDARVKPRGRASSVRAIADATGVDPLGGLRFADAAGVGSVRPGRVRNRVKTGPDEKVKKPADGVRKKSPPARKAPARGRYVDEYARPAR